MKFSLWLGLLCILLTCPCYLFSQTGPSRTGYPQAVLRGTIVDSITQIPVTGATVQIVGVSHSVISDRQGKFEFVTRQKFPLELKITSIGYTAVQLEVEDPDVLIHLSPSQNNLDQIVVVGYSKQTKYSVTGTVAEVKGEAIAGIHGAGFNERLQGLTPGLQISSNSGVEGGAALVRLRGATSINAGNDPLYIIDGVFINTASLQSISQGGQVTNPLADINPNDIENIQILKDANATAMYGSRASNGVIIVTTKRGHAGKSVISLNTEYGQGHYTKLWDLVTGPEHAEILNEQYLNDGGDPAGIPYPNPDTIGTYDRLHLVFRTAQQTTNSVSVTGGDDKTKFYIGGDFTSQQSILKLQDFQRWGFRSNIDHTFSAHISIGASLSYSKTKRSLSPDGDTGGILNTGLHTPTLTPIFRSDGTYNKSERFNNPYVLFDNNNDHAYGDHLIANTYLKWKLSKNLEFKSSWSLDNDIYHEFVYYNANLTQGASTSGQATDSRTSNIRYIGEQTLNYNVSLDGSKHQISAFLGNTLQKNQYENATIKGSYFPSIAFSAISEAAVVNGSASGVINSGLISYFGGVNYTFDQKYVFDANVRRDASSKFGSNNQWANFPSLGAAWLLGKGKFIRDHLSFVDDLKLKASLGWTGNQDISDFASLATWGGGANYEDQPGIAPLQLGNSNLKWETTRQWDLGLETALFSNRVSFTLDYYNKSTYNLLLSVPVPAKSGFTSIYENAGAMSNKGLEFQVNTINISTRDFQWKTSFNISHNKNVITQMATPFTAYNRDWVKLQQGYSMYSFWLYKQLYVDPQTGNAVYEDVNKDGKITTDDREIVGNAFPKFFGGFGNNFVFKNFDLNIYINYSSGNKVFNMNRYFQEHAGERGTSWSMQSSMLDAWQKPGDITDIPRITALPNPDGSYNHNFESSRFLEDGSFVRIKNITLGYTLSDKLLSRTPFSKIRAYLNVSNLLTLTHYSGADPEVNVAQGSNNGTVQGLDFSMPPHPRVVSVGLNLSF